MTLAALTLLMATIGLTVGLATLAALTLTLERAVGLERLAALTLLMATIGLTVRLAVHTKLAMLMATIGLTAGLEGAFEASSGFNKTTKRLFDAAAIVQMPDQL